MKNKSFIVLAIILFPFTYLHSQENNISNKRDFDFVISLSYGLGEMYNSNTNLLSNYEVQNTNVEILSARIGLHNNNRENGFVINGLGRLNGYSLTAEKENSLSYYAISYGFYRKLFFTIPSIENVKIYTLAEVNYSMLGREENRYSESSASWDKSKSKNHGFGFDLGCGVQYQVNKKHSFELGYDWRYMNFYKKINNYQEKEQSRLSFGGISFIYRTSI